MKVLNKIPLSLDDHQIDIVSVYLNFCPAI